MTNEFATRTELTTAQALRLADERGLPNNRGAYIRAAATNWKGEKPPCCAIGGAALVSGVGIKWRAGLKTPIVANIDDFKTPLTSDWEQIKDKFVTPPVPMSGKPRVRHVIEQLYDRHYWSRTQVADWLDTVLTEDVQ